MSSADDDLHYKYEKERFSRFVSILNIATEYGKIAVDRAVFVNSGALLFVATLSDKIGAENSTLYVLSMICFSAGILFAVCSSYMAYTNLNYIMDSYDKHIDMFLEVEHRDRLLNSNAPEILQDSIVEAAMKHDEDANEIYRQIKGLEPRIRETFSLSVLMASLSYGAFFLGIIIIVINISLS